MDEPSIAISTADALPLEFTLALAEYALDTLVAAVRGGSDQEHAYAESLACLWALSQRPKDEEPGDAATHAWRGALFGFADGALSLVLERTADGPVVDVHLDPAGKLCRVGVSDSGGAALMAQRAHGMLSLDAGDGAVREFPISPSTAGHWALGAAPGNRFPPLESSAARGDIPAWFREIPRPAVEPPIPAETPVRRTPVAQPAAPAQAWVCASCGAVPASIDAKFCRACGGRLPPPPPPPPSAQRSCGNCGSALRAQSRFCANCGAPAGA